jgi:DNA invertase Pin-like site-specific DNA recombinase
LHGDDLDDYYTYRRLPRVPTVLLVAKPTIDREEVVALKDQGVGATEIARRLGIGRASVYRVIGAA